MCETSTVDLTRLIGSVNLYTWTRHTEPIVRSGVWSLAQVYNFDLSHNDIQPILFDVNVLYNVPKMVFLSVYVNIYCSLIKTFVLGTLRQIPVSYSINRNISEKFPAISEGRRKFLQRCCYWTCFVEWSKSQYYTKKQRNVCFIPRKYKSYFLTTQCLCVKVLQLKCDFFY